MNDMAGFWKEKRAQLQRQFAVARDASVGEKISAEIESFQRGLKRRLIKNNPFDAHQIALESAKESLGRGVHDLRAIEADFNSYKELHAQEKTHIEKSEESYWRRKIGEIAARQKALNQRRKTADQPKDLPTVKFASKKLHADRKTCRTHLQKQWQKTLDEKYNQWELNAIAEYRRELLEKLQNWLELMQQLADALSQLSIEPGVLFDLSKDHLSLADMDAIKRWAEYLAQDKGVRELCEMLGRLRIAARAKREEWIKTTKTFTEVIPDIHSRGEIVGVRFGKDIEHALPQELALLADDETALLFDIKFAEGNLMHFDMADWKPKDSEDSHEELIEVEEDEKMGPIIVCVDTSGSMAGQPETIAKAVTLYMATKAIAQKRNCYLISFSTGIHELDLSGHCNIKNLIGFLQQSFGGGTDVAPAVTRALKMMKAEDYEKSDLLIISDFVMRDLPDEQRAEIADSKQQGNKFYSLSIGGEHIQSFDRKIFDGEWVYDSQRSNIRQLLDIVDDEVAA
ncbi:MAG: VWA domain-containing protein [Deltaproteobacteria bacterium]|nr:VWA domain-containing protein [Deltaproteobacteria bacterium]